MFYFGYEETLLTIIETIVFSVFFCLFVLTRKITTPGWVRYFHYAMGFMSLTYLLPLIFVALSFFVLEDLSGQYAGVISFICYTLPTVLACLCWVMVYRKRHVDVVHWNGVCCRIPHPRIYRADICVQSTICISACCDFLLVRESIPLYWIS